MPLFTSNNGLILKMFMIDKKVARGITLHELFCLQSETSYDVFFNKYNFNDDHSIFLSVKQSDNQKSAVADVPEVIGTLFGKGLIFIAGGIGAVAGIGGTIASLEIVKNVKSKKENLVESDSENTVA
jgi:hypothetical protein